MLSPQAKRLAAKEFMEHHQLSERAAYRIVGLSRSVGRYQSKKQVEGLKAKIIDLAQTVIGAFMFYYARMTIWSIISGFTGYTDWQTWQLKSVNMAESIGDKVANRKSDRD